jgi:hypothetical protein
VCLPSQATIELLQQVSEVTQSATIELLQQVSEVT